MAVSNNFMPLEVNIDSTKVIHSINKGNLVYETTVCECRSLLTALGHPPVNHSYREANRVADKLAKEASKMNEATTNFLVVPPVFANEAIWADILGTILEKKTRGCNVYNVAIDYNLFVEAETSPNDSVVINIQVTS